MGCVVPWARGLFRTEKEEFEDSQNKSFFFFNSQASARNVCCQVAMATLLVDLQTKKQDGDGLWCCLFPWVSAKSAKPGSKRKRRRKEIVRDEDDEESGLDETIWAKTKWKKAKDPETGRTYYYHSITRSSQWKKPAEIKLLEKEVQREILLKRSKFFKEMESNLMVSLAKGELIPGILLEDTKKEGPQNEPITKTSPEAPSLPSDTFQKIESPELLGIRLIDSPLQSRSLGFGTHTGHFRRNTGGTTHHDTLTTSTPTLTQNLIKCVCGIYRAHIVQSVETNVAINSRNGQKNIFLDEVGWYERKTSLVPDLEEVLAFYQEFYMRSRMEHDTVIMSLIYVERLIKRTNGALTPNVDNWRSILFGCMVLASKVWDDLSMLNADFSKVSYSSNTKGILSFSLHRINELELALLKSLDFDVRVSASEYAKYYFHIRNICVRSGLIKESENPLRKQEAFRKLENLTNNYQATQLSSTIERDRRAKSKSMDALGSMSTERLEPMLSDSVCLEQLVG